MKYLIVCALGATLLLRSLHVSAQPGQWNYMGPNPYYLGGAHDAFGDFTFVDSLSGYAIDNLSSLILKTVDGGTTWQQKPCNIGGVKMQFLNADTGWVLNPFALAKTTDGGNTWLTQFDTAMARHLRSSLATLQFLDGATGYVAGPRYAGKTTDGGNTWAAITPYTSGSIWQQLFFLNEDTGWVFDFDSLIAKTTDGGQTWTRQVLSQAHDTGVIACHFYSSNNGFALTYLGGMYKTVDGGNSWNQISNAPSRNLVSAKFGANGFVYAQGRDTVFTSIDTGRTWVTGSCPENSSAIFFFNPQHGFVGSSHIYQTLNGGLNWQSQIPLYTITGEGIFSYGWESPSHIVAPDIFGYLESLDSGLNWSLNTASSMLDMQDIDSSLYFLRETNYGISRYESGVLTYSLPAAYTLVYAKSRDSFIVSYQSTQDSLTIMSTTNGGSTWNTIFQAYNANIIAHGEWWDLTSEFSLGFSTVFARFTSWDTGVVAYREISLVSHEFVTFNAGTTWMTLPTSSNDFIASTKVSPSGGLYCYRCNNRLYAFYKFNPATVSWQFVSMPNRYELTSDDGGPDFDWSFDNILWTYSSPDAIKNTFVYSLDSGYSWNTYPLYINEITMLKRTREGQFVAASAWGELLKYNSAQYNCRISGNVFYDLNSNGVFDGFDVPARAFPININPWGTIAFTDSTGNYTTIADSGTNLVFPDTLFNYRVVPASLSVSFNSETSDSSGNNFALQPIDTNIRDLALNLVEFADSAPGFPYTTYITYSNFGVQPIQPVLSIILDPALTFDSASVPITTQHGDTISWTLPVLYPFQSNTILLYTTLDALAQVGQVVTITGMINPVDNDYTPANNYDTAAFVVSNSRIANYKTVNETSIIANQSESQTALQYTIHFQNTGRDTVQFVQIKDVLPSVLNPATLRVVASSAPCDYHIEMGNILNFRFNNIMLPDSAANWPGSQGFVSYVISPVAEILYMDTIYNSATIFFNYATQVNTGFAKTAVTGVVSGIREIYGNLSARIYPNPANNVVHIESTGDFTAKLFDLLGKPVLTSKSANSKLTLNINNLSSGMYILQIMQGSKLKGFALSVVPR